MEETYTAHPPIHPPTTHHPPAHPCAHPCIHHMFNYRCHILPKMSPPSSWQDHAMVWRTVHSEWLVEGWSILHHLVWDDDYCFECNSCVLPGEQLGQVKRCPECGQSWTTHSGRAMSNWESLIEHLLCKNDVANFNVAQEFARSAARAKAGGFSIGWVADDS